MSKIKSEKPSNDDKREFVDFFIELLDSKNEDADVYFTEGQANVLEDLGLPIPTIIKFSYDGKYHHTLKLHIDKEE